MSKEVHRDVFGDGYTVHDGKTGTSEHFHKGVFTDQHIGDRGTTITKDYLTGTDGFTVQDGISGGVEHFHRSAFSGNYVGDRGTTIYKNNLTGDYNVYQNEQQQGSALGGIIVAVLFMLGLFILCVGLVWGAGDVSFPIMLVSLAVVLIVWRVVVNRTNYKIIDKVFCSVSDMLFAVISLTIFYSQGYEFASNLLIWFCMVFVGIFLLMFEPKNKYINRDYDSSCRNMKRFFRLLACWCLPVFIAFNETMFGWGRNLDIVRKISFLIIFIPCFIPSIFSILKLALSRNKDN